MTVRELINKLERLDEDKNIWLMYDPPYSIGEVEISELVDDNKDYATMFAKEGVKEGDYAIIAF